MRSRDSAAAGEAGRVISSTWLRGRQLRRGRSLLYGPISRLHSHAAGEEDELGLNDEIE